MRKMEDPDVLSQALAEPTRRAILEQLRIGQKSVTVLVEATGRKQPNISNHLAKMRRQGLVRSERLGRQVFYSIATPFVDLLLRLHEFTADPLTEMEIGTDGPAIPFATQLGNPPRHRSGGKAAQGGGADANGTAEHSGTHSVVNTLHEWQEAYCHSILEGQEDRAQALVNAMLSRRLSLETIYIGVFQWALNHIGELYQSGETDEAHEHMASAITERMMAKVAQFYSPVSRTTRRALLGCVAGNWHYLGLRMLADGLRGMGWDALFLGANTPSQSFLNMIPTMKPDLVILSCAMDEQWPETARLLERLETLRHGADEPPFLIAVGGHYVHEHHDLVPAHVDFTANDLSVFLKEVRRRFYGHADEFEKI